MRYSNITALLATFLTGFIFMSCNVSSDEPEPPAPEIIEPGKQDVDTAKYFHWYDLELKTYNGKDCFIDKCSHADPTHCSGREPDPWTDYSRYSDHQYISVLSATDSTIKAQLSSGWFNVQYLPGCTKGGAVAVPRIVPTQNDMIIDFKKTYSNSCLKAAFCDTAGNNIYGTIYLDYKNKLVGMERNFHINGYEKAIQRLTFLSVHITSPDYQNLEQGGTIDRTYYSFNGFGDIANSNHFITATWKSNNFDTLAQGELTTQEFFTYITTVKFLDITEYFSCPYSSPRESMDCIMAMRFDETRFPYNTKWVEIKGHYKSNEKINSVAYDRLAINFVASSKENECLFFINPEILINGTTQMRLYTYSKYDNDYITNTSIATDKITFPMHSPKSYDWNAEMLLSLSPYTANGLPMMSQIITKDFGDKKRDYLTFSFSNTNIAKKFAIAYLSVLEDENNVYDLKNAIKEDPVLDGNKKKIILKILDNLNLILEDGIDFNVSFQLFGDLRDAKYWDDPYVWDYLFR